MTLTAVAPPARRTDYDTLWANLALAYERLSPGLRAVLDTLDVVHSARRSYAPGTHIDRTADKRAMKITVCATPGMNTCIPW